jgi:hypothetical protein
MILAFNLSDIISSLNMDPEGRADLDLDGVMRSFSGNGTIIDYYKMGETEISGVINLLIAWKPEKRETLLAALQAAIGTSVGNEAQIYDTNTPLLSAILEVDSVRRGKFRREPNILCADCGGAGNLPCGGCISTVQCIADLRPCGACVFTLCF